MNTSSMIRTADLQKEITKRRLWIIALTMLMSLCYYVLAMILSLTHARQEYRWWYGEYSGMNMRDYLCQSTNRLTGMDSVAFAMSIVVAVLMAYTAFSFLYKKPAVDFYFSAPLSRNRFFINIYLNGFAIYAGITAVFTALGLIIAACMNAVSVWVVLYAFVNFLRMILLYLAVYSITILAILISKNRVVSVIVTFIFLALEPLYRILLSAMEMLYYATSYDLDYIVAAADLKRPHILSPIYNHVLGMQIYTANCGEFTGTVLVSPAASLAGIWKCDLVTLALTAVVFVTVFFVFRIRKAEDIGTGVIKPYLKDALKLVCAVFLGLTGALATDSVLETNYSGLGVMNVMILVFVCAVACIATEMICSGSIRAGVKKLWHIIPAVACTLIIFSIYKYDLTGYDSYIPDKNEIETCALYKNYYSSDLFDATGNYLNIETYCIKNMNVKDLDAVEQIMSVGMEAQRHNMLAGDNHVTEKNPDLEYIRGNDAVVVFGLKNGKYVARKITIPADFDEAVMNRVIGTDEYRNCVFGTGLAREYAQTQGDGMNIRYATAVGAKETGISASEFERFLDEYEKDLKKYDYSLAFNGFPSGTVTCWNAGSNSAYVNYTFEIYDCYDNSIRFLKDNGIYVEYVLDAEDIVSIDVSRYRYDEETETDIESDVTFDDAEDIEELRHALIQNCDFGWNIQEIDASAVMYVKDYGDDRTSGDYVVKEISDLCIPDKLMPDRIDRILAENEVVTQY